MSFWQRFRFFLIGFIPGSIILFFIVRKNGCTSPNELKMLEIQYQTVALGNKAKCKLNCLAITDAALKLKLKEFEVNYDLSEVHQKPYGLYYLQSINKKEPRFEFVVEDKDTITYINDIKLLQPISNCNCDTVN